LIVSRLLLALASLLMAVGGIMHTLAFPKTLAAAAASNLPPFFAKSLGMLWLSDSAAMFVLALAFAAFAARPALAARPLVAILALLPLANAALLYVFFGPFFAGHIMLATAVLVFLSQAIRRET
jgi:hypothetical protein